MGWIVNVKRGLVLRVICSIVRWVKGLVLRLCLMRARDINRSYDKVSVRSCLSSQGCV